MPEDPHRIDQRLTMEPRQTLAVRLAPSMRMSLEILELPVMDLKARLESALQDNPFLEEDPSVQTNGDSPETPQAPPLEDADSADHTWGEETNGDESSQTGRSHRESVISGTPCSLQEHLLRQLRIETSHPTDTDLEIGETLIGNINENGYLTISLDEVATLHQVSLETVQRALTVIQGFDPAGVGARDLRECLLIQLEFKGRRGSLPWQIVNGFLDALGKKRFLNMAKALKVSEEDIRAAAREITTLDPKPGRNYSEVSPLTVIPEVVVRQKGTRWVAIGRDGWLPAVKLNLTYRRYLDSCQDEGSRQYLKEKLAEALFLMRAVQQRHRTVQRVSDYLVTAQQEFFEQGPAFLKPLGCQEVAEALGVNESTVSRTIVNKYLETPFGVYPMKALLSRRMTALDGEVLSCQAVKEEVLGLLREENTLQPLSDQQIAGRLRAKGFSVARRTVAKYREQLKILPAHLRKA